MQTKSFTLKVITPLHIGGAESSVLPMSFVVHEGWIYVVNEEKLAELLAQRRLLDTFVNQSTTKARDFRLHSFLEGHHLMDHAVLARISAYKCIKKGGIPREFRPFIRNGFAQPFIPGSAVKGAWRTAILYCLLKRVPSQARKAILEDPVNNALAKVQNNPKAKKGVRIHLFESQEARLLRFFQLGNTKNDIHTDFLRILKVHDSQPLDKDSLCIREIQIYSAQSSESPKRFPLYVETVEPGVSIPMAYSIDEQLLNAFRKQNSKKTIANGAMDYATFEKLALDPIGCAREMALDVLTHERTFFSMRSIVSRNFLMNRISIWAGEVH